MTVIRDHPSFAFVRNDTRLPIWEVLSVVEFAYERTGGITRPVAVWVKKGAGGGRAHDQNVHGRRVWMGRHRFGVSLTVPSAERAAYGMPRVCWHSSNARTMHGEVGLAKTYEAFAEMYERGERRFGRWPIYVVNDWQEHLLNLAAHELAHVVAYDRSRRGSSEVWCEEFAEAALNAWRTSRSEATILDLSAFQARGGESIAPTADTLRTA